ncbi:MAG: FixH family protein [Candidatus Pelagadaptatus aseana]|uniref:FixH family protein n=1 Tax=Candidatus Pelagadaptatus aseana TaxID=3120508 RepID=UPI0039B273DA
MSNTDSLDVKPWYRQTWAWFVLSPLILIVFVGAGLLAISFKGADDVVKDNYYKVGRMINQSIEEDLAAKQLGLTGELVFDMTVGEVILKLTADDMSVLPEALALGLDHPVEADYDLRLTMRKVSEGYYIAELDHAMDNRWYIRLSPVVPEDSSGVKWRIVGEIDLSSGNQLAFGGDE